MSEKDKVNATIYLVIIALIIYVLTVVSIRATKLPLLENRLILIAENDVNYTFRDISNGYVYEVPKGKEEVLEWGILNQYYSVQKTFRQY